MALEDRLASRYQYERLQTNQQVRLLHLPDANEKRRLHVLESALESVPHLRETWPALVEEIADLRNEVDRIVNGTDRLIGTLFTFDPGVDYIPPYNAVSYTWGPRDAADGIWLSDQNCLPLTSNAAYILRRIRYEWIWIDSICIDQTNADERSQQVLRMWRIYHSAKVVTVWLGDLSDDADLALDFLANYNQRLIDEDLSSRLQGSEAQGHLRTNNRYAHRWHALSKLLQRNWFTRCWIIQEISTAADVEITCGGKVTISWKDLSDFVQLFHFLQHSPARRSIGGDSIVLRLSGSAVAAGILCADIEVPSEAPPAPRQQRCNASNAATRTNPAVRMKTQVHARSANQQSPGSLPPSLNVISLIERTRVAWRESTHLYTLQHHILNTAECYATDSRDRIYALLSFSFDGLGGGSIFPDFNLSTAAVLRAVTKYFSVRDKEFLVLHMAGFGFGLPATHRELPTWVPDYTLSCRRAFANGRITILGRYEERFSRACSMVTSDVPSKLYLRRIPWNRGLTIEGMDVDTVQCVLRPPALEKGIHAVVMAGTHTQRAALLQWFQDLERMWYHGRAHSSLYMVPYSRAEGLTLVDAMLSVLLGGVDGMRADEGDPLSFFNAERRPVLTVVYYSLLRLLRDSRGANMADATYAERDTTVDRVTDPEERPNPPATHITTIWEQLPMRMRNQMRQFLQRADELSDWCVFVTKSGRVGRGPPLAGAGDRVVVFRGGRTPFVLRAVPWRWLSNYEVVGEAYVEGLMAQEVMRMSRCGWRPLHLH